MLFSDRSRSHYQNAPAHEVICQLRFPTILSINQTEPADFQEAIREAFPQYARRQDVSAPKISGLGGPNPQIEQQPPVSNYNFLSADGTWKINLTPNFIALSTLHYTGWEDFAAQMDKPLAAFIKLYQPAYFQRVGLRYVNIFSRARLGIEDSKWADLFSDAYTGPLQEEDVNEADCMLCSTDLQIKLDSSCMAKVHAGPGRMKPQPNAPQDNEVKFILDMDVSMNGNVQPNFAAGAMETVHAHATRLFEGAITDTLRNAMSPEA